MTTQPPPPYNKPDYNLAFTSSQEERRALEEWAESKKYVTPGKDGTLPAMDRGGSGLLSLVWGGPMETGPAPTSIPESPAHSLAILEKSNAAKREKKEKEERRMNHKASLREKLKKLVKRKQQEEAAPR
jgi:hypothetical protein